MSKPTLQEQLALIKRKMDLIQDHKLNSPAMTNEGLWDRFKKAVDLDPDEDTVAFNGERSQSVSDMSRLSDKAEKVIESIYELVQRNTDLFEKLSYDKKGLNKVDDKDKAHLSQRVDVLYKIFRSISDLAESVVSGDAMQDNQVEPEGTDKPEAPEEPETNQEPGQSEEPETAPEEPEQNVQPEFTPMSQPDGRFSEPFAVDQEEWYLEDTNSKQFIPNPKFFKSILTTPAEKSGFLRAFEIDPSIKKGGYSLKDIQVRPAVASKDYSLKEKGFVKLTNPTPETAAPQPEPEAQEPQATPAQPPKEEPIPQPAGPKRFNPDANGHEVDQFLQSRKQPLSESVVLTEAKSKFAMAFEALNANASKTATSAAKSGAMNPKAMTTILEIALQIAAGKGSNAFYSEVKAAGLDQQYREAMASLATVPEPKARPVATNKVAKPKPPKAAPAADAPTPGPLAPAEPEQPADRSGEAKDLALDFMKQHGYDTSNQEDLQAVTNHILSSKHF